jgi:hypothetical protein
MNSEAYCIFTDQIINDTFILTLNLTAPLAFSFSLLKFHK